MMIRAFQHAMMALRYSDVPVVVAPAGLTLGGGAEIALHADRVQAAAETYMGLVEVGVGLIPAGGGTKEMLVRAMSALPTPQSDPLPYVQKAFETDRARARYRPADRTRVGSATSRPRTAFTMNRERLIADAKARALDRVRDGYRKPAPRTAIPVGGASLGAALQARRAPGLACRPGVGSRRADRAEAGPHLRRRRPAASDDGERAVPARSGARGVPRACSANGRRSSGFSTRSRRESR